MSAITQAEQSAILAVSQRIDISFPQLRLSEEHQARKLTVEQRRELPSVRELAASIQAIGGLLQNLVVVANADGTYDVCAGGNRWAALGLLIEDGLLPVDYDVPCLVVPVEFGHHASLLENVMRSAMHPADVFDSYARLRNAGMSIATIAAAHGATDAAVRKLLALGDVSPKLIALFRQDKIKIEAMQALAAVTDHGRQEAAWEAARNDYYNPAQAIRRLLAENEARGDSAVARYVTVAAYEKAGGAVRRDLFAGDDASAVYLEQPELLETLALEKIRRSKLFKAAQKEGWGWVECAVSFDHEAKKGYGRLSQSRRAATADEVAEIDALQAKADAVAARISAYENDEEDLDDTEVNELYGEHERLEGQIASMRDALIEYPASLKAHAGVMVHLDWHGNVAVTRGLVRKEDRDVLQALAKKAAVEHGDGAPALLDAPVVKTRPVHSEALVRQLTAHKTAIVRATLGDRPGQALALLAAHLGEHISGHQWHANRAIQISISNNTHSIDTSAPDFQGSLAEQSIQRQWQRWLDVLPTDGDKNLGPLLPWMLDQSRDTVVEFLGFCVAASLDGLLTQEPSESAGPTPLDRIGALLGVDSADWWEPTEASYLGRVSKGRIEEVVRKVAGDEAAKPLATMKKGEAARAAEGVLRGKRWVPEILRIRDTAKDTQE